ncbi:SDR family NAD(P)-dependent oxidoreductase [Microbacterium sp.]|uniref:SDR family NAD(P)-dependent oxidoreductase n=1 Tax=Microbacterium sp. TaxID=51671 RepID=UPI0039E2492E
MDINGNVFVVTGAGNGIGRQVALQLLREGARVAGVDLNEAGLAETASLAAAGERFSVHAVNITDRDAVAALPAQVIGAHGKVDGILNVAGVIQQFVKVIDLPYAEIEKVMNVNFWGVVNVVKAFLPELVARPAAAIVNVSSMGALAPVPGQAVYGASKAAVSLLTQALYAEFMGTNVAVTVVYPGAIGTNIAQNSGVSIAGAETADTQAAAAKTTSPEKAGAVIVEALRKGSYRATIGGDAAGLDKLSRFSPKRATEMIAGKMAALLG